MSADQRIIRSGNTDEALRLQALRILRLDPSSPGRLVSRENSRLEYKETFNWGSRAKYARTMAAFANHDGGFIVFGVRDSPRDLLGVDVKRFDDLDPARATEYLNSALAPEIEWEAFRVEVAGLQLGVVAVKPAISRPVVCTKTDGSALREADIYYRYRGRSERIRYPELQRLLSELREHERDAWLRHLSRVAHIGVENVGLLDLVDGELSGSGGRLLISEALLKQVQFIREGRFTQRHDAGVTTLRLVGEVEPVAPGAIRPVKTIAQPVVIGERELLRKFLRQEKPQAPTEYIKQACRENSPYMPIYHFARAAGLTSEALRAVVVRESGRRSKDLLGRVDGAMVAPVGSMVADTQPATDRRRILDDLRRGDPDSLRSAKRVRLFEAVTHFEPPRPPTELLGLLAGLIEDPALRPFERTLGRKAVAHLDEVLNRAACIQRNAQDPAPMSATPSTPR